MREKRRRLRTPSPAIVIGLIALFVSLGGVGYAATTIGSAQIRDNSISGRDIKNGAIGLRELSARARAGLRGARGAAGATGPAGPAGATGPAGPDGRSALSTLRSGERIYGTFGVQGDGTNLWTGVSFQIPAPEPVDSRHVVIAGNDVITGDGCSGTKENPVSAPGYVCIYPNLSANTATGYGWGALCSCSDPTAVGDGSRFGFMVQVQRDNPSLTTANGTWAYTAP